MRTTSSITMQRLGENEQRAPAVGAKMWCLFLRAGFASKPQTAGIKLKNLTSAFSLDSLHRFTQSLAEPSDTWVRLAVKKKFSRQSVKGGGTQPQKYENFHFLVKSCRWGAELDQLFLFQLQNTNYIFKK